LRRDGALDLTQKMDGRVPTSTAQGVRPVVRPYFAAAADALRRCSPGEKEERRVHTERSASADTATEPRVRRVVAEHLGIGWEDLRPYVSLTDDLAADSLDLAELVVGLEDEFDLVIPDSMLGEVRTYAELVACVEVLHRRRGRRATAKTEGDWAPGFVAVQIVPPGRQRKR